MHITLELTPEESNLLKEQANRNGTEMSEYAKQRLFPQKSKTIPWSQEEVVLFQKINRGFSQNFWQRLRELDEMRFQEKMSEPERQEYLSLSILLENANVERLQALMDLARLRGTNLDGIMNDLEIKNGKNF